MEEKNEGQYFKPIQRYDGVKVNMEVRQKYLHCKKRHVKSWSPEEDQELIRLYNLYPKKWALIAQMMMDRNQNQCLHRYRRLCQLGSHQKIWSPQEDETVKKLMKKIGKNWKLLSELLGTKTGKQIRQRFINKLDPRIKKQDWTDQQDRKIIELYSQIGKKWSQISKHLPGRPQNKIKNRFYSYIQKNYDIRYRPIDDKKIRIEKNVDNEVNLNQLASKCVDLSELTNKIENLGDIIKEDKCCSYSFPSINQMDLEIKIEDFQNDKENGCSRMMLGSLMKVQQDWMGKEKMDDFQPNCCEQNDLFYLSS